MSAGIILFAAFAVCLIVGVPVSISLGVASLCSVVFGGLSASSTVIAQRIFGGLQSTSIMAIAFFVLAGNLMTKGGISRRIVNFANCLVGNVRGGMSLALVLACAFFAALSGSAPATVIAIGTMLYNDMVKLGYPGDRTAGLLVVSGGLGPIIPPSIIMVIYCTLTGASVGNMFKQGMLIGIVIMLVLMAEVLFYAKKENWPKQAVKRSPSEIFKIFLDAIPALMTPIIILGGIYSGIMTPTESSAVCCFYCMIVGLFIYRELSVKDLVKVVAEGVKSSAGIMLIVAATQVFGWVLTRAQIPQTIAKMFTENVSNGTVFLFAVCLILLVAGCFIDAVPALLIFAPIFCPTAQAYGLNMVHFGVVMVVVLCIGLATPPVGINLYVASSVGGQPVHKIIPHLPIPLLTIAIATIVLILCPPIVTLLPTLFG